MRELICFEVLGQLYVWHRPARITPLASVQLGQGKLLEPRPLMFVIYKLLEQVETMLLDSSTM